MAPRTPRSIRSSTSSTWSSPSRTACIRSWCRLTAVVLFGGGGHLRVRQQPGPVLADCHEPHAQGHGHRDVEEEAADLDSDDPVLAAPAERLQHRSAARVDPCAIASPPDRLSWAGSPAVAAGGSAAGRGRRGYWDRASVAVAGSSSETVRRAARGSSPGATVTALLAMCTHGGARGARAGLGGRTPPRCAVACDARPMAHSLRRPPRPDRGIRRTGPGSRQGLLSGWTLLRELRGRRARCH